MMEVTPSTSLPCRIKALQAIVKDILYLFMKSIQLSLLVVDS
jgi:hypothetical protein